uniref:C2H2-type domain-containing protein n=1 Tax=Globodera rostochiensis TaxID=31243 RepID=A0A914HPY0_GLORO
MRIQSISEALDGRLVIATDDERMDCTESAVSGAGEDVSAVAHNSSSKDDYASHPKKVEQNCWEGDSPMSVPNSVLDSFKAKCNSNETAEGIDKSDIKMQKLPAELVKWEELDGGVVPISEGKPVESDRKSRVFDLETKGHLSSESNKSPATPQYQHGVHNFLRGGTESRKKKLMLDKGTCVLSRPTGVQGLDEHLLAIRPGTNLTIDITIICKAGSNTLYISAKWKGREYHGVLTDGEPLFSHTYAQKRNAAQNAEKLVLETGSGNSGGAANQKIQNSEKASASGVGGKRGGKRGVGGHSKGGGVEKRAKNHSAECQSGGDAGDEAGGRSSKNEDKVRIDVDEGVADAAELGGIRQTIEKPLAHSHGHFQHQQQQSRRRRTSSSASSGVSTVGSKSGLYDGDAASRIRCPHQLCGHRFEKTNELNAHLLVGTHGVAGAKAKIFESSASQTTAVQFMSTGCDPFFPSDRMMPNNTKGVSFCTKCQKELAPETEVDGEGPSSKAKRPELLEFGGSGEKNRQKGATDNSPGFSDISDDAAPTLEKEESFDKQTEEAKKVSSTPAAPVPSLDAPNGPAMAVEPSPPPHSQNSCIKDGSDIVNKNATATPPKSAAVSINRQNLLPQGNKAKTADGSPANDAAKTAKKMPCSSIVSTIAKTPTTGTGNLGEPTNNNPYLLASTSDITTQNAVPSGFPFNPFFSYAPHLTQALASAIAQGTVPINAVSSSASPLGSSSVALSTGFKRLSPPCASGLLSLGTPLAASANQTPNGSGAPSKSAEPPAVSQPIQHKIYELQQQQQGGGLLGRSSSTKPSTSGMGHAQTVHIGTQGPMSGGSNVSPAVDMALMRPNSAISAVGYHQQPQNLQMHPTGQHQSQQSNRHCSAGAPSPIGGIGMSGGNGSVVHLPPPQHPFFPPLPSMIAGAAAQFGISAAPSILAAAAQQQMAALRRNNNGSVAHSGGGGIHQQQQQAVPVTQHPTASLMHPFIPQGLSPGMLAAAAAASNFDLNALQHYAATLIGSAPSADGVPPPAGQQQPNQK